MVPKKGKGIDIANIFRPFHISLWIAIFISMPIYAFFFYQTDKRNPNSRSIRYNIFLFFSYTLQQSINFTAKSTKQRFFVIIWVMCVLLFASMYQGKLSGSLIIPKDKPDIDTIEQLSKSDLKVLSFARYNQQIREFFSDPKYNGVYNPLFRRLHNITIKEFYGEVSKLSQSYAFANKYHINSYLRRVNTLNSMIFYHHVRQCAVPFLGTVRIIFIFSNYTIHFQYSELYF